MATRWPQDFQTYNDDLQRYMVFEKSVLNPMFDRVPENVDHIAAKMDALEQGAEAYFNSLSSDVTIVYSESERHHLHIADPDLVVAQIQNLLNQ